jgi:hypothetical protein
MRCEASTRRGVRCARPARAAERLCASHAARAGGGRRRGPRHGLYGRALGQEERDVLTLAREIEGVSEEVAMTRLMILRQARDGSPADYARLTDALKKLLLLDYQLRNGGNGLADALARLLDEIALELGLGDAAPVGGE